MRTRAGLCKTQKTKMKLKEIKPLCVKPSEAAALLRVRRKDIPALVSNGTLTLVRLADGVGRILMKSITRRLQEADEAQERSDEYKNSTSLSLYKPGNYNDLKDAMTCKL